MTIVTWMFREHGDRQRHPFGYVLDRDEIILKRENYRVTF